MMNTSANEQFDKMVVSPFRTYAALTLEHCEKLAAVQYEATKAYADLGIQQARAALDIKDPQGVQAYVESQQKAAQTIGERVKDDAEKVVALNEEFARKAQTAVQDSVSTATQTAGQTASKKS